MNGWWSSRTPREQWTVGLGVLAVLAVVVWLGVFDPLTAAHRRAEARYRTAADLDAWMERVGEEAERRRAAGQPVGEIATVASLSGLVSESTAAAGFGNTLKRVVPEENGAVRLWFEAVPFDARVLGADFARLRHWAHSPARRRRRRRAGPRR